MDNLIGEKLCAINIECHGKTHALIGVLWVDRWHPATAIIPNFGEVALPKDAINTDRSRIFPNIKLRRITNDITND